MQRENTKETLFFSKLIHNFERRFGIKKGQKCNSMSLGRYVLNYKYSKFRVSNSKLQFLYFYKYILKLYLYSNFLVRL